MALNVARAVQGVGAALLVPSSLSILNAAYAHDKKMLAKAIGWWTAAGGVSIAAGPVIGGLLLSTAGWRSIFWVNVPICIAGFALTCMVVPKMASKEPARHFDLAGLLLRRTLARLLRPASAASSPPAAVARACVGTCRGRAPCSPRRATAARRA